MKLKTNTEKLFTMAKFNDLDYNKSQNWRAGKYHIEKKNQKSFRISNGKKW